MTSLLVKVSSIPVLIMGLAVFLMARSVYAEDQTVFHSEQHKFKLVEVADRLKRPWSMAFLPDGQILVTGRSNQLTLLADGEQIAVKGLPDNVYVAGQGGVLDLVLHPDFERNRLLYLSYAGRGRGGAGTEVVRARLKRDRLEDLSTVFQVEPKTRGSAHYGSRLAFAQDGSLLITVGDRYHRLQDAQDPSNHLGSVMRINEDGSIPRDNPFVGQSGFKAEIYSYGHRNVQGLAVRPVDQSIWAHEHGPRGGDEVNKLQPGANFGWPAITYGIDYSGAIISDKTHAPGMVQPVVYWVPSIAPSGMAFYDGDAFPSWQDDLFVGALAGRHLRRLEMQGDEVVNQEVLLEGLGRIRDVRSGPDGFLYIATDGAKGKIYRLEPAD